jgi:hypothetical protein
MALKGNELSDAAPAYCVFETTLCAMVAFLQGSLCGSLRGKNSRPALTGRFLRVDLLF